MACSYSKQLISLMCAGLLLFLGTQLMSCKKKNPDPNTDVNPIDQDTTGVDTSSTTNLLSSIEINLSEMASTNGTINLAIYNNSSTFNDPNQVYRHVFLPCTASQMNLQVDSLPAGDYAFAIFHDENNNNELDQNWLGIPTEGFAFSNNANGTFGPPSWTQAQFSLPESSVLTQDISLIFY